MTHPLPNPSRRDVKALEAEAATLSAGDETSVVFLDDRHGIFRITGAVHQGLIPHELSLGGWDIRTTTGKVPKTVRTFDNTALPEGQDTDVTTITHGDFVTAEFEQRPYGLFQITGYATQADHDTLVMLGSWILTRTQQQASRLRWVKRHPVTIDVSEAAPPRRTPMQDGQTI